MDAVKTLFSGIRKRQAEEKASGWPAYKALLISLAQGDEQNPAEAEAVLGSVSKSEAELLTDVAKMETRIAAKAQLAQLPTARAAADAAEKKLAELQKELEAHHVRLKPQIDAASHECRARQQTAANCASAESTLIGTCLDPEILEAETELNQRRTPLRKRRDVLVGLLNENDPRSPVATLTATKARIETLTEQCKALKKELASASNKRSQHIKQAALKRQCDEAQTHLAAEKKQAASLVEKVTAYEAELKSSDVELAKVEKSLAKLQARKTKEI